MYQRTGRGRPRARWDRAKILDHQTREKRRLKISTENEAPLGRVGERVRVECQREVGVEVVHVLWLGSGPRFGSGFGKTSETYHINIYLIKINFESFAETYIHNHACKHGMPPSRQLVTHGAEL